MNSIAAIILAAGGASRFGKAKQLLEIDGEILIDRACRIATEAGCAPILRVVGARAPEILARSTADGISTLVNENWKDGMGATLALAITELEMKSPGSAAVLVILCDQPLIDAAMLKQLIAELSRPGISIVLADSGQTTGPPALFLKCHFAELKLLTGDRGAKLVANQHPQSVAKVLLPAARWDIDSAELWNEFQNSRNRPIIEP